MWGFKGGRKKGMMYPTVQNVMAEFYKRHHVSKEPDFSIGEIPKLTWSLGRFIFSKVVRILLYSSLSVALKGK